MLEPVEDEGGDPGDAAVLVLAGVGIEGAPHRLAGPDLRDVALVEHGDRLLRMFDENMSEYTRSALEDRGVTVRLGESVKKIEANSVTLGSGEVIDANTTVWGAGLRASPLAEALSSDLQHGRVPVGPMLNLDAHPEVYVVGDLAWITDAKTQEVLPQLGSVALQAGAVYLLDRGYIEYALYQDLHAAGAFFVARLKNNSSADKSSAWNISASSGHAGGRSTRSPEEVVWTTEFTASRSSSCNTGPRLRRLRSVSRFRNRSSTRRLPGGGPTMPPT